MMESVQLGRLNDQAEKGNVAAEKQLTKMLEKGRLELLSAQVADRGKGEPKLKKKLGKKEEAELAAQGVKGKFAPPEPPSLLN
jgi:hypothetical protein